MTPYELEGIIALNDRQKKLEYAMKVMADSDAFSNVQHADQCDIAPIKMVSSFLDDLNKILHDQPMRLMQAMIGRLAIDMRELSEENAAYIEQITVENLRPAWAK